MLDMDSGQPHTAHTSELVPFTAGDQDVMIREGGKPSDIAYATHLMDLSSPAEMTGQIYSRPRQPCTQRLRLTYCTPYFHCISTWSRRLTDRL